MNNVLTQHSPHHVPNLNHLLLSEIILPMFVNNTSQNAMQCIIEFVEYFLIKAIPKQYQSAVAVNSLKDPHLYTVV